MRLDSFAMTFAFLFCIFEVALVIVEEAVYVTTVALLLHLLTALVVSGEPSCLHCSYQLQPEFCSSSQRFSSECFYCSIPSW